LICPFFGLRYRRCRHRKEFVMLRRLTLAISLAALGCARAHATDPSEPCFQQLASMERFEPVRPLIALSSTREQTLDMITNLRVPAGSEKAAIKAWIAARDQCFVRGADWRERHMPGSMRQLIDLYFAKSRLLAAELYSGQITYADFTGRRADLSAELHAQLDELWREAQSEHASFRRAPDDGAKLIASGTQAMHAEASRLLRGESTQAAAASSACSAAAGREEKSCLPPLPAPR
jgi:hypothetical protein